MRKYLSLTKFTLSFLVVFNYVVSYLLSMPEEEIRFSNLLWLSLSGFLLTGAGAAANHLLERKTDALMSRTQKRPLVSGEISPMEAKIIIIVFVSLGLFLMQYFFNTTAMLVAALGFFLYIFVYTPMKKYTSFAVVVGAIPGSLPCLIGWLAGNGSFTAYAWVLFLIQFFWQFPHFWSLAWLVHDDYKKAGYHLLPFGLSPSRLVAIQTFTFCLPLLIASLLPYFLGVIYSSAVYIILLANMMLLINVLRLIQNPVTACARRVMFSCYLYLPIVYLSLMLFKK